MKQEVEKIEDCPNIAKHTKCPTGYNQWHAWAEELYKKGWRQKTCKVCGFYAIWAKPKLDSITKKTS